MIHAEDLDAGAKASLGPRQRLHVRFHAARGGGIELAQMTDAKAHPWLPVRSVPVPIPVLREVRCFARVETFAGSWPSSATPRRTARRNGPEDGASLRPLGLTFAPSYHGHRRVARAGWSHPGAAGARDESRRPFYQPCTAHLGADRPAGVARQGGRVPWKGRRCALRGRRALALAPAPPGTERRGARHRR